MAGLPKQSYRNPVQSGARGAVAGSVRFSQGLGKMVDAAANRRVKLNDALGKLRGK